MFGNYEVSPYISNDSVPSYKFDWSNFDNSYPWKNYLTDSAKPSEESRSDTTTKEKKTPRVLEDDEIPLFVAKKLDRLDGFTKIEENGKTKKVGDNKITAENWQAFATLAGIPVLPKNQASITVKNAAAKIKEIQQYNNGVLLSSAMKDMGLSKSTAQIAKEYGNEIAYGSNSAVPENKQEKNKMSWYQKAMFSTVSFFIGGEGEKLLDNPDSYTSEDAHTTTEIRNAIMELAKKSSFLPLSQRLLNLSVDNSKMLLRHAYYTKDENSNRQKIYTVLDANMAKRKSTEIKMPLYTTEEYANTHLKTVLFGENSKESTIVSNDSGIIDAVNKWFKNGKKQDGVETAILNSTRDTHYSIHKCYVGGMNATDNGESYTVTGYIQDIYDFAQNSGNEYSSSTEKLNYMAYKAQERGAITPYRVLIPFSVTIPKK